MKKLASQTKIGQRGSQLNINSPKALPHSQSKKLFKPPKGSMQACQDSELKAKSKVKVTHRQSVQPKPDQKQDIRHIEVKLKELEKKIDTLRHPRKAKEHKTSSEAKEVPKRSQSKIKESITASYESKAQLASFKKKEGSLQKVLKKTQSDKYLLRAPKSQKSQHPMNTTNPAEEKEEKLIHKFVTQVTRSETSGKGQHQHTTKVKNTVCYYIENSVESFHKNYQYLLPFRQHLAQSVKTLKYLKNNRKPTLKQLQRHSVALPPPKHKCSLVLDLDETLIHCNQHLSLPHDATLKIKFPTGQKIDAGVNIRPFAKELLKQLSKSCEIIVFTASHECYANVVLDHLDPKGEYVSHRLFRTHCWQTEEGVYIKDLRVLKNRALSDVLLVDNAAYSYFYQLENGIPIIPYYDDKQDQELLHLIQYIKDILEINQQESGSTLQQLNHRYFQLSAYHDYEDIEIMANKLYKETVKCKKMIK